MGARLFVGALVVLLTGCSQGMVARTDVPSHSPTPLPTPAMSRACLPDAEQPVPPPGLPSDAICVSSAHGNFDGLSGNESVITYRLRGRQQPLPWYYRVELGTGQVLSADLKTLYTDLLDVFVLGAADARGDGRDEAFVVLTHGASTDVVGILGVDGSRLALAAPPSPPGGFAFGGFGFSLGGGDLHFANLQCVGSGPTARLVASGWGSNDGGKTFTWESTTYRWSGMRLTAVSSQSGSASSWDDPQLAALGGGLNCNGLRGF